MDNKEILIIQKNKRNDKLAGIIVIAIGTVLFVVYHATKNTSEQAIYVYWMAILFVILGIGTYFWDEEFLTTIDPHQKRLQIKSKNRFSSKSKMIRFNEIQHVEIKTINRRRHSEIKLYTLRLRLKNGNIERVGKESFDSDELMAVADQLALAIGCSVETDLSRDTININFIPVALVGSIGLYALWYRLTVGKLCAAMWGGTAPIVIIPLIFYLLLKLNTFRK